jgi:integrase
LYFIKSRNLWRGVIDIGYNPNGTRKQKSVYGKTQREARAKLDELKAELAEHGAPLDKTTTVEAFAHRWLDTVQRPKQKPAGLRAYTSTVNKWIVPQLGRKRLAQLKPSDLRALTRAVYDAGGSADTAIKVHTVMSSMLESARLDGMIARNIARDVDPPKKKAVATRGELESDDALRVLQAALKKPDGVRWWFAILTGMRQMERSGATLDSIVPGKGDDAPSFVVRWSLTEVKFEHGCGGTCSYKRGGSCPQRRPILADEEEYRQLDGRLFLVRPKSGKPRAFPLIPQLADMLNNYLEQTRDVPNPHSLIWRNPDGTPITPSQDQAAWRDILCDAGVITAAQAVEPKDRPEGTAPVPTTHWGRHTTATVLRRLNVPAHIIAAIVGHANEKTTDSIYVHVSEADMRTAMQKLGTHFNGALEP